MDYSIKNERFLKKVLWLDALLGGLTAVLGLLFFKVLTNLLGLSVNLILTVSTITLLYATVAFVLAIQKPISVRLLKILVNANWIWTAISVLMLFIHLGSATMLGYLLLIMQIMVVGGLAYLEGSQIIKSQFNPDNDRKHS